MHCFRLAGALFLLMLLLPSHQSIYPVYSFMRPKQEKFKHAACAQRWVTGGFVRDQAANLLQYPQKVLGERTEVETVRPPAVAGTFYPGDKTELAAQIRGFIQDGVPAQHIPVAIIAPHAGYMYSGPIAGSAYASLHKINHTIDRVVMLGPAHREFVFGVAASSAEAFDTPLGRVPLDTERIRELVTELDFVEFSDSAHRLEHSLEVQLPFLQLGLADFELLPFAVGDATPDQIDLLLEKSWQDESTLVVISSDLSHYRDYGSAQKIDRYTTQKIQDLDPSGLSGENACGQRPICGLLLYAARHGLACEVIDVRNSGDTAGPRDHVVGYGAYLFHS